MSPCKLKKSTSFHLSFFYIFEGTELLGALEVHLGVLRGCTYAKKVKKKF